MISNIDAIREIDIRDVIGSYIKLTKANKAKCPFHNEKSESFSIKPADQLFKCFGCGISGDSFKFVMEHERCSFADAAEKIAAIGGIQVEYFIEDEKIERPKREIKKPLYETIQWAIGEYSKALFDNADGQNYATARGLTDDVITKWQIGFAPNDFKFLSSQIIGKESPASATAIGLLRVSEKTEKHYDAFRNRLIFPVCNEYGQVVSLSGRTIDQTDKKNPKTIKGNNTEIMQWSQTLFGLNHARIGIKKHGYAILVEGEMDVISMHTAGADNTVGSGTKLLTREQCILLKRFTDHVVLMPDNDEEKNGKNPALIAAADNMKLLMSLGFRVDIFFIPNGKDGQKQDPDDFAKTFIKKPTNHDDNNSVFTPGGFVTHEHLSNSEA